jgi:Arc/MetJ family transcription regulator
MAKTLVDLDEELLAETQEILGTSTKKDTINAAMREVVRRAAARKLIELGHAGAYADLLDPEIAERAWRR